MDPRLLKYYNQELKYVRQMGAEFAREYPKIAGRLGLEEFDCADPYVERLLEGFSFLAARVRLKLDAEFPRFTQHLLEMVYPHYLAPIPSMAVVQLEPDRNEGSLAAGVTVPRESVLRSILGKGEITPCQYRTAHDVSLWPFEIAEAQYFPHAGELPDMDFPRRKEVKAGLRLRLRCTGGLTFDKLALESLPVYLRGGEDLPMQIYERLLANAVALVAMPVGDHRTWHEDIDTTHIRRVGFGNDQALLPFGSRSFQGYRLLQEYFSFPDRFLFVELAGLGPAVRRCRSRELDLVVFFNRSDPFLEDAIDAGNFALFCTPAINLFPKRTDRIHLQERSEEYHIVVDRTRPLDYEVFSVTRVTGHGTRASEEQEFRPFYSFGDPLCPMEGRAFYSQQRKPRLLSSRQKSQGPRSGYIGGEVFISLVDADQAPYSGDLRQLAIEAMCTNRDLPLHMPTGIGRTDFTMESGAPVESIRCLSGPTRPRGSFADGDTWRVISHLSLNYLSLTDNDSGQGAAALRQLLTLYADEKDTSSHKQIEGVRSVSSRPVTRWVSTDGPRAFVRGLEVTLTCEESAFEGMGIFLFGAVMEQFFSRYVSINSFTETVVRTEERGEVMRWPARIGRRHTL